MLQKLATFILRVSGWTTIGEIPPLDKAVFIAAPHTSNWDGFWLLVYKFALDVQVSFLAKHTLFWWPLGNLLTAMGAIPIDRGTQASTVQQLVDTFEREDHLFLALAPEGTRRWKQYWKTGFYRIACAANVPIVMAFIDYPNKRMGIGPQIDPAEGVDRLVAQIREFYSPFKGRKPENTGPIAFAADAIADVRKRDCGKAGRAGKATSGA